MPTFFDELPEVFVSNTEISALVSEAVKSGKLRRLGSRRRLIFYGGAVGNQSIGVIILEQKIPISSYDTFRRLFQILCVKP